MLQLSVSSTVKIYFIAIAIAVTEYIAYVQSAFVSLSPECLLSVTVFELFLNKKQPAAHVGRTRDGLWLKPHYHS